MMKNIIAVVIAVASIAIAFFPSAGMPIIPSVKTDSQVWADILNGMADYIEADGKTSRPMIASMLDVAQYRDAVVSAPVRRIDGGQRVRDLLGPKLAGLGTSVLNTETRATVVTAFRDAAKEMLR